VTYRLDSDVPWLYGGFMDLQSGEIINSFKNPTWNNPDENFYDEILYNKARNKTKEIAWYVSSNCNAPSQRTKVIKEVQKFIKVDIYGHCGPFK
jgi:hypothetical protein